MRYDQHENDVEDVRYQNFVSPLVDGIVENLHHKKDMNGLDFGSGVAPVVAKVFRDRGYQMAAYDPFYFPDRSVLIQDGYDFVAASEVVEHFYYPEVEFLKFWSLLRPGGTLGLMTRIWHSSIELSSWYYTKDPTHVSIYSKNTFRWIARRFGFTDPRFINDRIIIFEKLTRSG